MLQEKMIYFIPGEVVTLKQKDVFYIPNMIVKKVNKTKFREEDKNTLLHITCFWFTTYGEYQEQNFNTKDLKKV